MTFFHLRANVWLRKNFIQRLKQGPGSAISHEDKHNIIQQHYKRIIAMPDVRSKNFDWNPLRIPPIDLSCLNEPFSEEETLSAIKQKIPQEKTLGPDGFTGLFFKNVGTSSDMMSLPPSTPSMNCVAHTSIYLTKKTSFSYGHTEKGRGQRHKGLPPNQLNPCSCEDYIQTTRAAAGSSPQHPHITMPECIC